MCFCSKLNKLYPASGKYHGRPIQVANMNYSEKNSSDGNKIRESKVKNFKSDFCLYVQSLTLSLGKGMEWYKRN